MSATQLNLTVQLVDFTCSSIVKTTTKLTELDRIKSIWLLGFTVQVPVGPAKFDLNRCNESPLRGEKPDFWPVSKNNTGSLPLRGILPVTKKKQTPHFHTYSRRAWYDLPQTLHGDRARRAHHQR